MGSISINADKIIGGFKSITTSTTLAPPCDMNLSLDTSNVILTLGNGAFIGQKLSIVANATSSIVFLGVNGTITEGLTSGKKALLTWTGTYWLCSVSVVIEGKNATGTVFRYSGGLSVEARPEASFKTITINNSYIDPLTTDKVLLNINQSGASITLGAGTYLFQEISFMNSNSNVCTMNYVGVTGGCTDYIKTIRVLTYTWINNYWFCSSCPIAIGDLWKQYPNTEEPAYLYGGQWEIDEYGSDYWRRTA